MDDAEITALVTRLARPHPSGGRVIERADIVAAGSDSTAVIEWIVAHSGTAETPGPSRQAGGGLHGSRGASPVVNGGVPRRYVLPPGVL